MVLANHGISFGMSFPGVWLVGLVVWMWLAVVWWKNKSWGLGLMLIGGFLNLAERVVLGYVTDYWKVPGLNLYNNLNDWLIFIGVIVFVGENLWNNRSK